MVDIIKEYERIYAHIMRQREKAPICSICKIKLFDYTQALDEYFYDEHKGCEFDPEITRQIYNLFFEKYVTLLSYGVANTVKRTPCLQHRMIVKLQMI